MADESNDLGAPSSGPATVKDRRATPQLQRVSQYWKPLTLVLLAVGIFIWAALTTPPTLGDGTTNATVPKTRATAPRPLNATELTAYQAKMKELEQGTAAGATPLDNGRTLREPQRQERDGERERTPQDTAKAEIAKREFESLFASSVVGSKQGSERSGAGSLRRVDRNDDTDPSLDLIVDKVLRGVSQTGRPAATADHGLALPSGQPIDRSSDAQAEKEPTRTPPIDPNGPLHPLLEGTLIDTVLTNRLDGSSASPVNVLVTRPVYSYHGNVVLIPAGARVLGETKPVQTGNETRLAVSFHRLILPDGSTVSLDQYKALNQAGDTGLRDQVNNHYLSTFGFSAAVGLVSGLGQMVGNRGLGGGNGNNRAVVVTGDVGQSTSQATNQVLSRFLNRLPTVTIREGHRVEVYITKDLDLPPYPTKGRTQ
jgi:type IV secretory pathway VirB10-like protein